ncbi:MAG: hypothetical protein D6737_00355 [Chloroflexi bacterium]|nr:MAG: hypothetical protein D6737_00355 [Chloroflexota bacterium]
MSENKTSPKYFDGLLQRLRALAMTKIAKSETDNDDETSFSLEDLPMSESLATMLASEDVLSREWNTPEEDQAWDDL